MNSNELQKTSLDYWYIKRQQNGSLFAQGLVSGHTDLPDNALISTSEIESVEIRLDEGEAVVITQNTVYHCSFESCLFDKQDKSPDAFDNYDSIREKYYTPSVTPEIEQGKVLLVLSSFDDYYFHSMYATTDDGMIEEYTHIPHIGMIQDSYLIFSKTGRIDLRYFPYMDGFISFYEVKTFGQPLYIENIGPGEITITESYSSGKTVDRLHLNPGERKEYPIKK